MTLLQTNQVQPIARAPLLHQPTHPRTFLSACGVCLRGNRQYVSHLRGRESARMATKNAAIHMVWGWDGAGGKDTYTHTCMQDPLAFH